MLALGMGIQPEVVKYGTHLAMGTFLGIANQGFTWAFRGGWANVMVGNAGASRSSTWATEIYGQKNKEREKAEKQ